MSRRSEKPVDLSSAVDPVGTFRAAESRMAQVRLRTTGSSTGVVRTTASWVTSFPHASRLAGIGAASRVWVPGPPAASMNLFARVHAAYAGAELVDEPARATHATMTPSQLALLLDQELPKGLTVVVAGDRLLPTLFERATAAGLTLHHYYGATELSFVAWGRHSEDLWPFPGVEVEDRDGELWVRSAYLCEGYDALGDGSVGPMRRSPDGFATVGDRGRFEQGRLLVDGRPDAVTTGGTTVLVADVERALRPVAHGEVSVLGAPHSRLGSVVTAVLTEPEDHARLVAASRDRLPPAARPRVWFHVPALPVTDAGKRDRAALARLVADAEGIRRLPSANGQTPAQL